MDLPHFSSEHHKAVQDLLKRLKDANSELQRVTSDREDVNKEVHQGHEEMDRRMLLLLQVDDQVGDALMELEAARQKKLALIQLLQSLNTHTREAELSSVCLSAMQKQVEELEEEEEKLKLQCEQVKKELDDVQEV